MRQTVREVSIGNGARVSEELLRPSKQGQQDRLSILLGSDHHSYPRAKQLGFCEAHCLGTGGTTSRELAFRNRGFGVTEQPIGKILYSDFHAAL